MMAKRFLIVFLTAMLGPCVRARDLTGLGVEAVAIEIDGHSGFLLKPDARWPGGHATPWVLYAPALPPYPGREEHWMFERLLAAGVAIAGIDVGESYGSPEGRRVYTAFHQALVRDHGLTPRACLLARSRGGLMLYNWAVEHPENVAAIAGIYPVLDLRTYPGLDTAAGSYGMSAAEMARLLPLHNPVDRLAPLARAGIPLFQIHGDQDTVVPYTDNASAVRSRYEALGGTLQLVTASGQGHNMWDGFFQCDALVAFLLAHARAAAAACATPVSRIAFGSCAKEDRPQPVWDTIAETDPDLFLFIGDNVYADTADPEVFSQKYQLLAEKPGFRRFRQQIPLLATWDDHDYGSNDGGAEFEGKHAAKAAFLSFFKVPLDAPMRTREGVYQAHAFGPDDKRVQVILLDTRTFRDALSERTEQERAGGFGPYKPADNLNATMLGEAQWRWLEQQLKQPARLRVIASSVQVVSGDHGWECWNNFPHERARLFRLVGETRANGVIFVSGDRHLAELSCDSGLEGKPYAMFDLTSSGLNQAEGGRIDEPNRHRSSAVVREQNFGEITVDWEAPDPVIEFRIHVTENTGDDDAGKFLRFSHRLRLSELSCPE